MNRLTGKTPRGWSKIAARIKEEAGWCCVRCGHPHEPVDGHALTVAHLNGDRADSRWWNLPALCQTCGVRVRAKVILHRPWVFDHSEWFKVYVAGYYASRYLGVELSRPEVLARLDELLALEPSAVLGYPTPAIPLAHATADRRPRL